MQLPVLFSRNYATSWQDSILNPVKIQFKGLNKCQSIGNDFSIFILVILTRVVGGCRLFKKGGSPFQRLCVFTDSNYLLLRYLPALQVPCDYAVLGDSATFSQKETLLVIVHFLPYGECKLMLLDAVSESYDGNLVGGPAAASAFRIVGRERGAKRTYLRIRAVNNLEGNRCSNSTPKGDSFSENCFLLK